MHFSHSYVIFERWFLILLEHKILSWWGTGTYWASIFGFTMCNKLFLADHYCLPSRIHIYCCQGIIYLLINLDSPLANSELGANPTGAHTSRRLFIRQIKIKQFRLIIFPHQMIWSFNWYRVVSHIALLFHKPFLCHCHLKATRWYLLHVCPLIFKFNWAFTFVFI